MGTAYHFIHLREYLLRALRLVGEKEKTVDCNSRFNCLTFSRSQQRGVRHQCHHDHHGGEPRSSMVCLVVRSSTAAVLEGSAWPRLRLHWQSSESLGLPRKTSGGYSLIAAPSLCQQCVVLVLIYNLNGIAKLLGAVHSSYNTQYYIV